MLSSNDRLLRIVPESLLLATRCEMFFNRMLMRLLIGATFTNLNKTSCLIRVCLWRRLRWYSGNSRNVIALRRHRCRGLPAKRLLRGSYTAALIKLGNGNNGPGLQLLLQSIQKLSRCRARDREPLRRFEISDRGFCLRANDAINRANIVAARGKAALNCEAVAFR